LPEACCTPTTSREAASASAAETIHPLQPLTRDEIQTAVSIVRKAPPYGPDTRFETIQLLEPSKAEVRAFRSGPKFERRARVNVFSAAKVSVTKMVVSLTSGEILSQEVCPGKRPMIQLEQFLAIEGIVRANPDFIAACAKRGIHDMSMVCVDPWTAGNFNISGEEGRHLCHVFVWLRLKENENFYAHPVEGLNAVVDLVTDEVIRVDDYGVIPIPRQEYNYERQFITEFQPRAKRIDVVQPEGVNFRFENGRLIWRNWSLVIGFNAREALTLHDINFIGRPIIYRASIVEMTVPYGSPESGHFRKNVFDVGEYGIGKLANSLKLGCDCLGVVKYLDVQLNGMNGEPWTIEKAICIHEEDSGLLWKHLDFRTERTEVRRGAKLVISCICTVGNYEYALYWYLFLDGVIEHEVKATGIINTAACMPGQPGKYAREVAPGVVGQIHQHILCARMEMDLDGGGNSVVECNTCAQPFDSNNPYGNAFYEEETVFRTELEACRRANLPTQRYWKVINPKKLNHVGSPVGYRLEANNCVTPFVHPGSPSGKRASFVQNHLWVTAYDSEERYPAGEFMNHSDGEGSVADFVRQDRPIEDADIVLWHVFGVHHPVRAEDFPVQSCVTTGFKLAPWGFFNGNPTINLPPETNEASCLAKS